MAQTHDIEDVLSSIRRLVANEQAAIPIPPELEQGPMLLLDDEHRVTEPEPEDPFQMINTLAQEEMDGRDAEHFVDDMPEDVTAITEDLADLLPDEVEADATEWEDTATPDTKTEAADVEPETANDVQPDVIHFTAYDIQDVSAVADSTIEAPEVGNPDIEAEIAAMLDAEDAAEADGSNVATETPVASVADAPEGIAEVAKPEAELWAEYPVGEPSDDIEAPTVEPETQIIAPAAPVIEAEGNAPVAEAQTPVIEAEAPPAEPEVLPTAPKDPVVEAETPVTQDETPAPKVEEPAFEVENPAEEPALGDVDLSGLDLSELDFDAPMASVAAGAVTTAVAEAVDAEVDLSDLSDAGQNEEVLRDMIAEIVRQELAGELGERITRNVRKLVRREIRQIMAAEDFD